MKNMKIGAKLTTGFIIVAVVAAIIGVMGIFSIQLMNGEIAVMYEDAEKDALANKYSDYSNKIRGAYRYSLALMAFDDFKGAYAQFDTAEALITERKKLMDKLLTFHPSASFSEKLDKLAEIRDGDFQRTRTAFMEAVKEAENKKSGNERWEYMSGEVMTAFKDMAGAFDDVDTLTTELSDLAESALTKTEADTTVTANTVTAVTIVIILIGVVAAMVLGAYLSKLIAAPITLMSKFLSQIGDYGNANFTDGDWAEQEKVASGQDEIAVATGILGKVARRFARIGSLLKSISEGDITVIPQSLGQDDIVGNSFIAMVDNLNAMFGDINNATVEVSSGAGQISDGAQNLAQGSTEQAATVQELSASIQDVLFKTQENREMARNTATLSNTVMDRASAGTLLINDMTQAVMEINQASAEISKVIKVIDDIAFQTNILALNAAVEAARAGEAGKGFAVVADEVRNLASKSAAAAKETNSLIENSVKKAEQGSEIAAKTASAFAEIVDGVRSSVELINNISESSDEQAQAIAQINTAIDQVSEVVQRNSATAEQSAASSEELNAQSNILSRNVAKFKLRGN